MPHCIHTRVPCGEAGCFHVSMPSALHAKRVPLSLVAPAPQLVGGPGSVPAPQRQVAFADRPVCAHLPVCLNHVPGALAVWHASVALGPPDVRHMLPRCFRWCCPCPACLEASRPNLVLQSTLTARGRIAESRLLATTQHGQLTHCSTGSACCHLNMPMQFVLLVHDVVAEKEGRARQMMEVMGLR